MTCTCRIVADPQWEAAIEYCPTHKAAFKLLAIVKSAVESNPNGNEALDLEAWLERFQTAGEAIVKEIENA